MELSSSGVDSLLPPVKTPSNNNINVTLFQLRCDCYPVLRFIAPPHPHPLQLGSREVENLISSEKMKDSGCSVIKFLTHRFLNCRGFDWSIHQSKESQPSPAWWCCLLQPEIHTFPLNVSSQAISSSTVGPWWRLTLWAQLQSTTCNLAPIIQVILTPKGPECATNDALTPPTSCKWLIIHPAHPSLPS